MARYFSLDHPLAEICASLPNDPAMQAAAAFCRGLRIMRQPRWECLATFITSSMKQVAHIRQISRALRERFGTRRSLGSIHLYSYPRPEVSPTWTRPICAIARSVIARKICSPRLG